MAKRKSSSSLLKETALSKNNDYDYLRQLALGGLLILMILPPYFRGLFFAPEQQAALIFAALVFWLTFSWRLKENDYSFLRGPLDYCAVALPAVYMITTLTAVNKGLAINEVVKHILYFLVFWSVSRLVRSNRDIMTMFTALYLSALGVALAGLATATGIIQIRDGFLNERIYSTFQYPNALASYLAAIAILGLYLWARQGYSKTGEAKGLLPGKLDYSPYIYSCGNYLLLAVLLGTQSRGGLLAFGLGYLIYLVGLAAKERLMVILHTGIVGSAALLLIIKFIPLAANNKPGLAWLWFFALMAAVLIGQFILSLIDKGLFSRWAGAPARFNQAFGALAVLAASAGGAILYSLPSAESLLRISNLRNVFERMYFVTDALAMIRERPLLGWGGGGWKEAYQSFQGYYYTSSEVHSFYFQLGVETGLAGLLVVAGIWASFSYYIYLLYQGSKTSPVDFRAAWALAAAFLIIAGHAMIDFDLSLAALTLALWAILGTVNGMVLSAGDEKMARPPGPARDKLPRLKFAAATAGVVVILIFSLALLQAGASAREAGRQLQSQQIEKSLAYLKQARVYNPVEAKYSASLSQIYRAQADHAKSLAEARRAVELSPYNAQLRINLADSYLAAGEYALAAGQAAKAVELSPYQRRQYEELATVYFLASQNLLEAGEIAEAKGILTKAAGLPEQISSTMEAVPEHYVQIWQDGPLLAPTETIWFTAGASMYHLGQDHQAGEFLRQAAASEEQEIKGMSLVYLALLAERRGGPENAAELINQAENILPEARAEYDRILNLGQLQ